MPGAGAVRKSGWGRCGLGALDGGLPGSGGHRKGFLGEKGRLDLRAEWVRLGFRAKIQAGPEGEGEGKAGTPPTFRAGFLESARKSWDLIWGLDLDATVFIETADRAPNVSSRSFSPHSRSCLGLSPKCWRTQRLPPHAAGRVPY